MFNFLTITKSKPFIAALFLIGFHLSSEARNYYFSSSAGDDSYTSTQAQSQATPWKSIAKLNSFFSSLAAGDSVLFKSGDIFYGSIIVTKSGNSSSPIVISSYGSGGRPVISGIVTLSSWTSLGGGIYQSSAPLVKSNVNLVALNGIPQQVGRFPNKDAANGGFLTYETYSGGSSITDNQLTSSTNWTGAEAVIRKSHYLMERCKITNHAGSVITYTTTQTINPSDGAAATQPGSNGFGYFIQRDSRTLDQFGEWYFEPAGKNMQMYFGSNSPSSYTIKTSAVDTLVNLNTNSYINISNLAFEGGNLFAVYGKDAGNLKIQNCDMSLMGTEAIFMFNEANVLIENVNTNYVLCNSIDITSRHQNNLTIRGCNIKNTGQYPGMGSNWSNADYKGIYIEANSTALLEYNHIDTTGYIGIHFQGNDVTVKNNFVNYYDYVTDDGGGIYTFATATPTYTNRVIKDNIVLNGIGAADGTNGDGVDVDGIFLDGATMNVNVLRNSVANIGVNGVYCNNPNNITLDSNTVFNTGSSLGISRYTSAPNITNLNITHNILYPKYNYQDNFSYSNSGLDLPTPVTIQTALQALGNIENNYYYTPEANGFKYNYAATEGGAYSFPSPLTFDGWRLMTNHDLASKLAPKKIPTYTLNSLVGSNTVSNGQFTSDISNTNLFADGGNYTASWDNTSKITGTGSLKITPTTPSNVFTFIYKTAGAVTANKSYILRFSTLGTNKNGLLKAWIRQTNSPYNALATLQLAAFGNTRVDHEFLFTANATEANTTIQIEIQQASGATYIDNIEFYEATATPVDINTQLRFEYNATSVAKTIALGANYLGVDSSLIRGTLTLLPYTSKILIRDTGTVSQTLTAYATAPAVRCYGGTSAVSVSATGGNTPYTGTGSFSVAAGSYTYTVRDATGATATASINVTQPAAALQIATTAGTITTTGGVTTVTVSATGGVSPYSGTGTFSSVAAGTYTYTVTDANSCTASKTITLLDPVVSESPLQATATASKIICYGGTSTVTVSGIGGTSPYTGTGSFSVSAGSYTYTVRDATGTTASITINVTQPASALQTTVTAGTIAVTGGTTSVTVSATGGLSPYTGTGTFASISAGTYTYTVTDANGCAVSKTITIANPVVSGSTLLASATASRIACYGGSSSIAVSATGGTAPYTGTGSFTANAGTGALKLSFPTSVSNVYTSLSSSSFGAISSSKNYVVKFSTLGTTSAGFLRLYLRQTNTPYNTLTTSLPSASFGTSRIDHQFIFTAPTTEANASFVIEVLQSSGTVYIDNIAVFEATSTGTLIGNNLFSNGQFETSISNITAWSPNSNQTIALDTAAAINNTYYYTVKDATGASSTAVVTATQASSPLQISALVPAPITVAGGTTNVVVTATGGISPYTGTGTFTVLAGSYTYTVKDAYGCTATATVAITQPVSPLLASSAASRINCFGGSSTVTVSGSGGKVPYTGTGTYTVTAGVGSLKLSFPTSVSTVYTSVYSTFGAVSSSKNYAVRFSTLGTATTGFVRVYLRQTNTPFNTLTTTLPSASFGTARVDHQFVFTAPTTEANASFVIEVLQSSGTTYIDNIAIFEVSAAGALIGSNLFSNGQFETNINNITAGSTNNNQTVTWDNTSKIANTYYYNVTDAAGTTSVTTITATQPAAPLQASAIAGTITVPGGYTSVSLTAIGGTTPYAGTGTFSVKAGTYSYTVTDANGCTSLAAVTIPDAISTASLQAFATATKIVCFGGSSTVSVTAAGGTAPYTGTGAFTAIAGIGSLKISFPASVSNVYSSLMSSTIGAVSAAKNYVLRFSTLGTTSAGFVRAYLRQTNTPYNTLSSNLPSAAFGLTRVDHQFIFPAPTSDAAATFVIEVLQSSGITYIDNISFFEATSTGTLIGSNLFGNSQFKSDITGITAWSPNTNEVIAWDNTSKINNVYYYTVKDATGASSVAIVNATQASAPLQATSASGGAITVAGGTTSITVSATGGVSPYTGTGTFTSVSAGAYSYTVTDANGCTSTTSITITEPSGPLLASATASRINCYGGSSTLSVGASGGTAPYTGTGTFTVTTGIGSLKLSFPTSVTNNYTALISPVGGVSATKNYVLRFTTLGTTASGFLRVYLAQAATPFNRLTSGLPSASFGTTRVDHQFIFTAPTTEANAAFTIEIQQSSGTTYIDNLAFFEATSTGTLIGANILRNGQFEANISNVTLWSSNNNQTAVWDNTSRISNTYYYAVTDAAGTVSTAFITPAQPAAPLKATASAGTITTAGGTATVTVSATGGTAPYSGTGSFTITAAGTYTYTVTDANACTSSITATVTSTAARLAATTTARSIATTSTKPLTITTFPNPTTTDFGLVVESSSNEKIEIIVKATDGRTVYQTRGSSNQKYNFGGNLLPGLYFIQVIQGMDAQIVKAVKTKL